LEGRTDDLVVMEDGRRVGRLDPVFKQGLGIAEAQIIQETLTRFRLLYVSSSASSTSLEEQLRKRLRDHLGAVEVVLERVDEVPRTAQGKFRAVMCRLTPQERQMAVS
jgi:phenylacetate-CoA ligase